MKFIDTFSKFSKKKFVKSYENSKIIRTLCLNHKKNENMKTQNQIEFAKIFNKKYEDEIAEDVTNFDRIRLITSFGSTGCHINFKLDERIDQSNLDELTELMDKNDIDYLIKYITEEGIYTDKYKSNYEWLIEIV